MNKWDNNVKCSYPDCNKKIKLTDFPCKCDKIFCKIHRLPEDHNCVYNYKENDVEKKVENMKCISEKINRI
tara:strand:- start:2987 stop:3199 length:213 start_codon:yes stop_codon:yes gene_type:complete